jgi:bile acid:Na+ symporter, BASS family
VTAIEITIQILTCSALVGLLGAVGLRLTYGEVRAALRPARFALILLANFILVPALAVAAVRFFHVEKNAAVAIVVLAAAPFAPVVPVFARLARADLALAAALTGVFPIFSAILTPFAAQAAIHFLDGNDAVRFHMWNGLAILVATVTLPLAVGLLVRHFAPRLAGRWLRPMEMISEAIGAISLAFVVTTQFALIAQLGWRAWLATAVVSELSLFLGWQIGGPRERTRRVVAFGTSNRNIALALLVAIQSFHGLEIPSAVAGNGLLLIVLGLVHVAWWRFRARPGRLT